jgi:hypothetical protein
MDAEDSKAYFRPHLNMYGRIKPILSENAWLNETDWLKIVLDKAHARGLRAGAEVSHTYIPQELLNSHPEWQQRDIENKAVDRPCTNNPDVREYLLALYGDLATNYDVDYLQTCMLLFSNIDNPQKGTCFCESCQKTAKEKGFDLTAAMPILKDNPYAQPQLDQWLAFRTASTTEIYKLVTDRIHSINPKIDFRLNDLNNRSSGLHLDELKNNVNSVHLSTHTEQRGFERLDRASRIKTTFYYGGPNIPIIAGVPTRLLTTVAIVKSSVKISVINGSKGLGVKHYDGSPYSLLRALRNGIYEAGVSGFTPIIGTEIEDMTLSGYTADTYLQEKCVKTTGTGTAVSKFDNPSGLYTVIISYADEKGGKSSLSLSVAGKQKTSWKLEEDVECWRRKKILNVKINKGDEIKIVGVANGTESARVDFIEYVAQSATIKVSK